MQPFTYRVRRVHRVVDGDTVDLEIDLGFYQFAVLRFRLLGVDTPEKYGRYASPEGQVATDFAEAWLTEREGELICLTEKADSFGRWLAHVYHVKDFAILGNLSQALIDAGHGTPYPT